MQISLSTLTGPFVEARSFGKKPGKFWSKILIKCSYESKSASKVQNWPIFGNPENPGKPEKSVQFFKNVHIDV